MFEPWLAGCSAKRLPSNWGCRVAAPENPPVSSLESLLGPPRDVTTDEDLGSPRASDSRDGTAADPDVPDWTPAPTNRRTQMLRSLYPP